MYPQNTEAAFQYANDLGYDGIELMVWAEPVSQDIDGVAFLSRPLPPAGAFCTRTVSADLATGLGSRPRRQAGAIGGSGGRISAPRPWWCIHRFGGSESTRVVSRS